MFSMIDHNLNHNIVKMIYFLLQRDSPRPIVSDMNAKELMKRDIRLVKDVLLRNRATYEGLSILVNKWTDNTISFPLFGNINYRLG